MVRDSGLDHAEPMQSRLKIKLQLRHGDGFAMGPGKADLLEAIDREGSISAAGRILGMSYRRAWLLVDETNRAFADPLVLTLQGGGRERGARLTEVGRSILADYRALEHAATRIEQEPAFARTHGAPARRGLTPKRPRVAWLTNLYSISSTPLRFRSPLYLAGYRGGGRALLAHRGQRPCAAAPRRRFFSPARCCLIPARGSDQRVCPTVLPQTVTPGQAASCRRRRWRRHPSGDRHRAPPR